MSGIAGVLHFDGRPADPLLVRAMTEAVRHRGPDVGDCWVAGSIGLGHRLMWSTPEAVAERQPHADERGERCLVFDGRVDNRDEVAHALRAAGVARRDDSDAELVLRACEAWGEDAPRRMLGDFAFALWDGRTGTLFCARDILGVRPFHYFLGVRHILFGSELHQLFRDPTVPTELNEGMIGEYLAVSITNLEETFYRSIRRLPPAHWMKVERDGRVRIQRYWQVDFAATIRYAREEDCAWHLLDILKASVACRLRVEGPLGSDLSGGLDSSAVSVIAQEAMDACGSATDRYQSYSVTYPGLPCDESDYIKAVGRHAGIRLNLLPYRQVKESEFEALASRYLEFPGYPVGNSSLQTVSAAVHRNGCRVMLSGLGGDEWLTGEPDFLADLLKSLRLTALGRELPGTAAWHEISAVRALMRFGIKPWLRRGANALGILDRRKPRLPWLSSTWVARNRLGDRISVKRSEGWHASCAQLSRHAWAFSATSTDSIELSDRLAFGSGIEYRHPLLDRRIIDYAYAVPQELHLRQGLTKNLLRKAMQNHVPDPILNRRTKSEFSLIFTHGIDEAVARCPIEKWPAAQAGWLDVEALTAMYGEARQNLLGGRPWSGLAIWATWMAYGIGLVIKAPRGV